MTLIKCFTVSHIDNITACLRLRPEKMIMVGEADEMNQPIGRYRNLLQRRGQHTEITACNVQDKDFEDICGVLNSLVKQEADCVIDLTGGDASVILAVGAVLAGLDQSARQRIRVEKYDHDANAVLDYMHDNRRIPYHPIGLTAEELVALHGGAVHPDSYQPPLDYSIQALEALWDVVSSDPKAWNRGITQLNEFESRSDSKTQVYLPLAYLRDSISNFNQKEVIVRDLLEKLQQCGVIHGNFGINGMEYTYADSLMRYCTLMAGNVLEVKTILEGRAVQENGEPFFSDCRMGVNIDWDGIVHDPEEQIPETRNEVDAVLMHGVTPLFVSCKNGKIGEEELYKLHTVAHRFGGPYAKKMLIATELDQKSPVANRAFIQRAWDMHIYLVTDAADLTREEWSRIFMQAMQ